MRSFVHSITQFQNNFTDLIKRYKQISGYRKIKASFRGVLGFAIVCIFTITQMLRLQADWTFTRKLEYVLIPQSAQAEIVYLHYHSSGSERSKSQYKYS